MSGDFGHCTTVNPSSLHSGEVSPFAEMLLPPASCRTPTVDGAKGLPQHITIDINVLLRWFEEDELLLGRLEKAETTSDTQVGYPHFTAFKSTTREVE